MSRATNLSFVICDLSSFCRCTWQIDSKGSDKTHVTHRSEVRRHQRRQRVKRSWRAARKAIRAQQQGHQVVMVVSAMGKQTDVLVDLAKQITEQPPAREMDMLLSTGEQVSVALMAMAIHALGGQAVSLTGGADRHQDRQLAHQGPHPVDLRPSG